MNAGMAIACSSTAKAVASGGTELALRIKAFPGWQPATTAVEIAFEGDPPTGLPELTGAGAVHHAGQTFVTWKEIETLVSDNPSWTEVRDAFNKMDAKRRVRYRIYTSDEPVTAESLPQARLLAEVKPLSGLNVNGRSADQAFHWMRQRMLVDMDFAKRVSNECYDIPPEAHDAVVVDQWGLVTLKQVMVSKAKSRIAVPCTPHWRWWGRHPLAWENCLSTGGSRGLEGVRKPDRRSFGSGNPA